MPKRLHYQSGQKINGLIFLKDSTPYISPHGVKRRRAQFRCHCGKNFETTILDVKNGNTTSCGCQSSRKIPKRENYHPNQKINNLTFIKETEPHLQLKEKKIRKGLFKCSCGNEFEAIIDSIKSGHTKSCGCLKVRQGGLSYHPLMNVWNGMKHRCNNEKHAYFKNYGGRGIKVCDEWMNDFKAFYDWSISNGYKSGLEIDRINNDGNYEPSNCRFVTASKNCQNRGSKKLTEADVLNIRDSHKAGLFTAKELAKKYGVSDTNIYNIIKRKVWR